jgi:hypothetical protein
MTAYILAFLTERWVWEDDIAAPDLRQGKAMARAALETLVREESPDLACVTLMQGERKLGVWDWVEGQAVWTRLS